ncbi:MAG: PA14 domain-containing protein, partial [Armatimonadota bacterium]|nr:PA14 domain-containing protein [Armatimonadota bacterium]
GVVGLITYWQDADNYLVFKWLPDDGASTRGQEKQLWRIWRGQPMLLVAAAGGYRPQQWYHLAVGVGGGLVNVAVDGQQVLQKHTDLFGQGKIGLYCSSEAETLFDDVQVSPITDENRLEVVRCAAIIPQFTKEQTMENWASPKGEWLAATGNPANATEPLFWNRGAFFGDYALELKATGLEAERAKVTAVLCGDGASVASGYALVVTPKGEKDTIEAVLLRAGKALRLPRSVKFDATAGCKLRLERAGRVIRAYIGKEMIASYLDPKPLTGLRAGYAVQGATVQPGDVRITGGNFYDYTFYRAPTDWLVSGGTWDMTSRWDCSPNWSWYGGWSERIAAIWNKHSFSGDYVVEVFAACKRDVGGYKHPRDINITIAGDGRDLASGYSCIFGGWNNTFTRILRGTRTVGETSQVLLPKNYQAEAHRKWFCLRVEKTGDTISFFIDRKLVLKYKDPMPLAGRHVALWTRSNGVMIARATIYYENEVEPEPLPLLVEADDNLRAVRTEKLHWKAGDNDATIRLEAVADKTTEHPAVRVVNLEGGGRFAAVPEVEPFDALKTSQLSFDCRLTRGTEINLYLRIKGIQHCVNLTGPTKEEEAEGTKVIGLAAGVRADAQWHTVNLDLAALLKPLYPSDAEIKVEEIFLGNLTRDTYAQAGFGANYPGTHYLIRSFTLRSSDHLVAKIIEPQLPASTGPALATVKEPVAEAKLVAALLAASSPSAKPATTTAPFKPTEPPQPAEPARTEPVGATRGLFNLRATFCQDTDAGEFKAETLNKPIPWECFSQRIFTRTVDIIDFDWAERSPGSGIRPRYWSARFIGKLLVPGAGDYTFYLDRLDDGGRLYIDGEPVIDSWLIQSAASHESKPLHLTPGAHDFRFDFCQAAGLGSVTLRWQGPGFEKEIVPHTTPDAAEPPKIAGR